MRWAGWRPRAPQQPVNIFGNSSVFNSSDPSQNRQVVSCSVPAPDAIFIIPSEITASLPIAGPNEFGTGSLGISTGDVSPFLALLANGQRLDAGVFAYAEYMVNSGPTFAWK